MNINGRLNRKRVGCPGSVPLLPGRPAIGQKATSFATSKRHVSEVILRLRFRSNPSAVAQFEPAKVYRERSTREARKMFADLSLAEILRKVSNWNRY